MNLKDAVVNYKSYEAFFEKEKLGLKRNTVREIRFDDARFRLLYEMHISSKYGKIQIHKTNYKGEDLQYKILRQITDVSFFKQVVIVSW